MGNNASSDDDHYRRRQSAPATGRPTTSKQPQRTRNAPSGTQQQQNSNPPQPATQPPPQQPPPQQRTQTAPTPSPTPKRHTYDGSRQPTRSALRRPRSHSPPASARSNRSVTWHPETPRRNSMSPPKQPRKPMYIQPEAGSKPVQQPKYVHVDEDELDKPRLVNVYDEFDAQGRRIRPKTGAGQGPRQEVAYKAPPEMEPIKQDEEVLYVYQRGNKQDPYVDARRAASARIREFRDKNKGSQPVDLTGKPETPRIQIQTTAEKPPKPINYEMRKQQKPRSKKRQLEKKDLLHPNYVPSDAEYDDDDDDDDFEDDDDFYTPAPAAPPPVNNHRRSVSYSNDKDKGRDRDRGKADERRRSLDEPDPEPEDKHSVIMTDYQTASRGKPTTTHDRGNSKFVSQAPQNGRWIRAHKEGDIHNGGQKTPYKWERGENEREVRSNGHRMVSNSSQPPPRKWNPVSDPVNKKHSWHSDFLTDDYF